MKKIFIVAVLLSACLFVSANETEANKSQEKENKTLVHPENFSHWSLSVGGGANILLGDVSNFRAGFRDYIKKNINWSVNFQCEYMINPAWGVMLEYMYSPQNKNGRNYNAQKYDISIYSNRDMQMHEVNAMFVFNILNLVRRTRTHTNWNFFVNIGAGALFFESSYFEEYHMSRAFTIPLEMSVEYCPIPSLGISLDAKYRFYAKDAVNGISGGEEEDMGLYGGLCLRYHILADKKPHVHVVDMNTYEPLTMQRTKPDDDRIEELESKIDFLTDQINKANTNIATLEKANQEILRETDSITAARIGNVASSMNNLQTQLDSLNVEGGDEIYYTTNNIYQYNSDDNGIYFDYNSDVIKSIYYKDVLKIALRMLNDNKLKLRITGYCDARGSSEYNKELAQRRINAIIYILVNRFRIAKDRFVTNNMGKIDGGEEIYELNRRVDYEYFY